MVLKTLYRKQTVNLNNLIKRKTVVFSGFKIFQYYSSFLELLQIKFKCRTHCGIDTNLF